MTADTAAAIVVASVALIGVIVLAIQVRGFGRRLSAVPKDGDVVSYLRDLDGDLASVEKTVDELVPRLSDVEAKLPYAMSHVGVVTYDAFGDIAGKQSRSIAIIDHRGNGLVLSVLVGRSETLFFTKKVVAGRGLQELSPEEQQAVDSAVAE